MKTVSSAAPQTRIQIALEENSIQAHSQIFNHSQKTPLAFTMRFSTLAILSLPLAVLASPLPELEAEIEKRASDQYSSVLSSLNSVLSDTNTMNDQLNGFATTAKPNFFQLAALQNSGKALQTDLNSANSSATASSAFTTTEATALYTQLHDKLLPSVQTVMKNWVAHYP